MSSRIREIRESRGLRREDVASLTGISYEYVRKLEADDPPTPGLEIARKLASALGVTVDELFPASDPEPVATGPSEAGA